MSKAILASAFTAIVLVAMTAGCGGGDDDGSSDPTTAALTKAEFIKAGDAICSEASEQSETEAEEFAEENNFTLEDASKQQVEDAVAEVLVPSLNQQAEDLAALAAPEGDEEQVEAIVTSLEDAAAEIEEDPGLVFDSAALKEPSQLADRYGFKVCGEE